MSIPPYKKLKTNQGEAVQSDPEYESTDANTKRKTVRKPLNILDLNSDCLEEIFDLRNVSVLELALVAQTCTQLRTIATDVFVCSHKICNFETMELDDAVMADRVLATFGSSILVLRIDFNPYSKDSETIIDSILRNCSKLRSLTMESYAIPDCPIVFEKMQRLFGKLESLNIEDVSIDGWERWRNYNRITTPRVNVMNFFDDCNSLVHLKVVDSFVFERVIFESKFPKLQHFHYSNDSGGSVKGLRGFAFRHQNLKSLILDADIHTPNTIESISANCTKLQQWEFSAGPLSENFERTLKQLSRLQDLEKLKIDWNNHSAVEFLKAFQQSTSLKVLELHDTLGSWSLLPTIAKMNSLRTLKLCDIDNLQNLNSLRDLSELNELFIEDATVRQFNFNLVDIIEGLVNLKKFKFYVSDQRQPFRISRNIYYQLVNVLQHRSVVGYAYLEVDCPTTRDFQDLLCPAVELKDI